MSEEEEDWDDGSDGGWDDDEGEGNDGDEMMMVDGDEGNEWGDGQEDQESDLQIDIENMFYQADDLKRRDPHKALEQFTNCYALEESVNLPQLFMQFKCLQNIVSLHMALEHPQQTLESFEQLLKLTSCTQVSRNEASQTLTHLLQLAAEHPNSQDFAQPMFALALTHLQQDTSPSGQRLYFTLALKRSRALLEVSESEQQLRDVLNSVKQLHSLCTLSDGTDDSDKSSQLLELYAMEVQIYSALGDSEGVGRVCTRTKGLSTALKDARSMSVIQECWGKSYAGQGDWDRAYLEFWEAFLQYQQIGDKKAKQCLKYVVLANMLSSNATNPFSTREARAYEHDEEIAAVVALQEAYDRKDIHRLEEILGENVDGILGDPFIRGNLEPLLEMARSESILVMIRPYRRVTLGVVAERLGVSEVEVRRMVVRLILDEKLDASVNQLDGVLTVNRNQEDYGEDEHYYSVLRKWTKVLKSLTV